MNWWLETRETLPAWLLTLLAAGIFVWLARIFLAEWRRLTLPLTAMLFALRAAAFLILGMMLLQVTYVEDRTPRDTVIFLLDDSASMCQLPDAAAFFTPQASAHVNLTSTQEKHTPAVTRLEALRAVLDDTQLSLEARLKTRVDVKTVALSDLLGGRRDGMESPLGAAVHRIFRESTPPPKAIIFFTDAAVTDEDAFLREAEAAGKRGVILDTAIFGSTDALPRLRMTVTHAEKELAAEDVLNVRCTLTAESLKGRRAEVILRDVSGNDAGVKTKSPLAVLARAECVFSEDAQTVEIQVKWQPVHVGEYACVLEARVADAPEASPLPEFYADFLQAAEPLSVLVTDRKYRIFLAWQKPAWEFRYLLNLLAREKNTEVAYWLGTAEAGYVAQNAAAHERFPERAELETQDLLILGDVDPRRLGEDAMTDITRWLAGSEKNEGEKNGGENVEDGHARVLMCVAGPAFTFRHWRGTALENLLPFYVDDITFTQNAPGGAKFVPTPLGATTPGMRWERDRVTGREAWETFPPIYQFQEIPRLSPAAMILAELHVMETPGGAEMKADVGTMRGAEVKTAENPHNKIARKIPAAIFYPGPDGKIFIHTHDATWRWRWRDDENAYRHYWLQTVRWLCRGAAVEEKTVNATKNPEAEIAFSETSSGRERPHPADAHAEFRQLAANPALAQKIAALTGGAVYGKLSECRAVRDLPRDLLLSLQTASQTRTDSGPLHEIRVPLWRHGGVLLLLCVLLFCQWGIVRRVS